MKIRIIETKELRELEAVNPETGCDNIGDIIGNVSDIRYNDETEEYEMNEAAFDWWSEYVEHHLADEERLRTLRKEYDYDEIQDIIEEELASANDYENHHDAYARAFERIVAELEGC